MCDDSNNITRDVTSQKCDVVEEWSRWTLAVTYPALNVRCRTRQQINRSLLLRQVVRRWQTRMSWWRPETPWNSGRCWTMLLTSTTNSSIANSSASRWAIKRRRRCPEWRRWRGAGSGSVGAPRRPRSGASSWQCRRTRSCLRSGCMTWAGQASETCRLVVAVWTSTVTYTCDVSVSAIWRQCKRRRVGVG